MTRGQSGGVARLTVAAALTLLASAPGAQAAIEVPELTGPVVDRAGLLSPGESAALTRLARDVRARDDGRGVQMQFLLLPGLDGENIDEVSIRVAEAWKIGGRGRDNGLLFVVARNERKVRIEVGAGLEGDLTDAQSSRIIREVMVPAFRDGDFGGGLFRAAARALEEMHVPLPSGTVTPAPRAGVARTQEPQKSSSSSPVWLTLLGAAWLLIILIYVFQALVRPVLAALFPKRFARSRRAKAAEPTSDNDDEPSSSSSDDKWSGGGGKFGGGGASGEF